MGTVSIVQAAGLLVTGILNILEITKYFFSGKDTACALKSVFKLLYAPQVSTAPYSV
jgi:hypothetical protein